MADPVPVITALTALVVAVGAFVLNLLKGRAAEKAAERAAAIAETARVAAEAAKTAAEESKAAIVEIDGKLYALGKQFDGQLTKLLAEIKTGAIATGRAEGVAAEKADQALRAEKPPGTS